MEAESEKRPTGTVALTLLQRRSHTFIEVGEELLDDFKWQTVGKLFS